MIARVVTLRAVPPLPGPPWGPSKRSWSQGWIAVLISCWLLAGCEDRQATPGSGASLARAAEYHAEGRIADALIEARNAVQEDPENSQALLLLARLHLAADDGASAEAQLARLDHGAVDPETLSLLYARVRLRQNRPEDALAILGEPDGNDPPVPVDRLILRGDALMALDRVDEAEETYRRALRSAPDAGAFAGLAAAAIGRGDTAAAKRHVESGLETAPVDRGLRLAAAELALMEGRPDDAEAGFRSLLDLNRRDPRASAGLARVQIFSGRAAEAAAFLDGQLRLLPGHEGLHYLRAVAAYADEDFETAHNLLSEQLASQPGNVAMRTLAGLTSQRLGRDAEATRHFEHVIRLDPESIEVRRLFGLLQLRTGLPARALASAKAGLETTPEDRDLLTIAGIAAMRSGDTGTAHATLGKAAGLAPDDPWAQLRYGFAELARGQAREAVTRLRDTAERNPEIPEVHAMLILGLLRTGQPEAALAAARAMQTAFPDHGEGFLLAGIVESGLDRPEAALKSFDRAYEVAPDARSGVALAALMWREGRMEETRDLLSRILARTPEAGDAAWLMSFIDYREGRIEEAAERLELALAANAADLRSRRLLAILRFEHGRHETALVHARAGLDLAPDDVVLLEMTVAIHVAAGRIQEARQMAARLAGLKADSPSIHFLLAALHAREGNATGQRLALDQALAVDPDFVPARLMQARMLLLEGKAAEAERLAGRLRTSLGNTPELAEVEGLSRLAQGDPHGALALLEGASAASAGRAIGMAQAMWRTNRRDEAVRHLGAWLDGHGASAPANVLLAEYLGMLGRTEKARVRLEMAASLAPDDFIVHNNLAWLLAREGNLRDALVHARKAHVLAPENAAVLDTLGTILIRSGEFEQALKILSAALRLHPDNPKLQVGYASVLTALGNDGEAIRVLETTLARNPRFEGRGDAETMVLRLREAVRTASGID
ncbi:MAG TPA: XrtA/PEP-CTERM system TPR-repeat protein PrsT [Arenibaculum sp.]|nr:XrtA/PEP-CTERM system TPR-repeat protein PrsT [Arenibaculum sp.]